MRVLRCVISWVAIVVVASVTPGCSSGGAGTLMQASCLNLAPAAIPAASSVTLEEGASSTCATLAVDVMVTDVTDVHAAGFGLVYDASVATYIGMEITGSLLGSDGSNVEVLEADDPGVVTVGLTRLGSNTGIDANGTQLLVRLFFSSATDAGDGVVTFRSPVLFGSETPPLAKSGIQWFAGTFLAR